MTYKYNIIEVIKMPRGRKKKELPALENNIQNTHLVQKSKPLFSLWKSDLTLSEFKILDTYLSRINSHNPEQRIVRFEKGELEKLLNVKQIKPNELKTRLKHLMSNVVEIKDSRKAKGFKLITLFEQAECEKDENGLWQVELACTSKAMEYIFNIEEIGYLRYKIRSITQISSLYSYILFTYLEYNRFRKSWEISLDELKALLNCTSDTYIEYKRFNDLILKKCKKELHEKTDIRYSYEPIKKGKKVVAIRFNLETLTDLLPNTKDEKILDIDVVNEKELQYNQSLRFLAGSVDYEFSETELIVLKDLVLQIIPTNEIEQYNCLRRQYNILNLQSKKSNIKNRFSYLKKLLENEVKEVIQSKPLTKTSRLETGNKFNQFPQREYSKEDMANLEKMLLQK